MRVLILVLTAILTDQSWPTPGAVGWVKAAAVPFGDIEGPTNCADLAPLLRVVGDARIVALGEATHGTHEFFTMKRRITECLARHHGFTLFAMEANLPQAAAIGDFVRSGVGDPGALVKGLVIWPWTTEELRDLVTWMREFRAAGGVMDFAGLDIQMPGAAMRHVLDFLRLHDATRVAETEAMYRRMTSGSMPVADASREAQVILDSLVASRGRYTAATAADVDALLLHARFVRQSFDWRNDPSQLAREVAMADNLQWYLERRPADTRVVVWAHNGHLRRHPGALGGVLSQRFADELVTIAFTTAAGSYHAEAPDRSVQVFPLTAPAEGSVEAVFAATELSRFLLDLRPARRGEAAAWLTERRPYRFIGTQGGARQFTQGALAELFDAVVYFRDSRPSTLLR